MCHNAIAKQGGDKHTTGASNSCQEFLDEEAWQEMRYKRVRRLGRLLPEKQGSRADRQAKSSSSSRSIRACAATVRICCRNGLLTLAGEDAIWRSAFSLCVVTCPFFCISQRPVGDCNDCEIACRFFWTQDSHQDDARAPGGDRQTLFRPAESRLFDAKNLIIIDQSGFFFDLEME